MNIIVPNFTTSQSLRHSLARGLATQAFYIAKKNGANLERLFKSAFELNPNIKSHARIAKRIKSENGVVSSTVCSKDGLGLRVIFRGGLIAKTYSNDQEIFEEQSVVYTMINLRHMKNGIEINALRVIYSKHALVRFVTRTNTSLNATLLETLDREAVASLTQLSNNSLKGNDLESYPIAKQFDGLWPSEIVETTGEDGWPKDKHGSTPKIRTLRVRTFLSPEEMSGGIYLIWKGDPKLSYSKSA